jgi:hypothetical protein
MGDVTWNDANYYCQQSGHQLITMTTPDEFTRARHFLSSVRKLRNVYVGARLTDRIASAPGTVAMYKQVCIGWLICHVLNRWPSWVFLFWW